MRPAFSSRTNRRGTTALAPALRLPLVTASDMRHLYCDLTRTRSALDRDCAANTCHDIEWDDRHWNGCASSSLKYGAAHPLPRTCTFRTRKIFWHRSITGSQTGLATADMRTARASLPQRLPQRSFAGDGHAREVSPGHYLPTFACRGARGIRTTPQQMPACRSLFKDPVQPIRCAGASAMEGRSDTPAILHHNASGKRQCQRTARRVRA